MYNEITLKGFCSQEFWYILSGLDIWFEQSKNDNPASKKLAQGCEIWCVIYSYFLTKLTTHFAILLGYILLGWILIKDIPVFYLGGNNDCIYFLYHFHIFFYLSNLAIFNPSAL